MTYSPTYKFYVGEIKKNHSFLVVSVVYNFVVDTVVLALNHIICIVIITQTISNVHNTCIVYVKYIVLYFHIRELCRVSCF